MFLFVASDAGPANYLGYVAKELGARSRYLATSVSQSIFESHNIKSFSVHEMNIVQVIITGTCIGDGIDKEYIFKAKEWGIPSVAVIEHWSWYSMRFTLGRDLVLPDYIAVNDEVAREKCIGEGLDRKRIIVLGNPVLEETYLQRKQFVPDLVLRKRYGFDDGQPIVCFISENLRADFPPGSPNYLGFDEYEVLDDIVEVCAQHHCQLFVKLHPSEPKDKYQELARTKGFTIISNMPKDDIFVLSDLMIGMGSMLLIEASIAGVDRVLAYRPNETIPFIGNELGATLRIGSKEYLRKYFEGPWHSGGRINFGHQFMGSTKRIAAFLENLVS